MNNLELYEKVRKVPEEAQKKIEAGRLKGKTDINPMWRIKTLTEQFGVCGFGWYTKITNKWIEDGANGEKTANVEIELYVKMNGEWSAPITGIGGSVLIAKESNGLRTDDDCYKKAYTDAISVACKALGFGGDIYWQNDPTKYHQETQNEGSRYAMNDKKTAPKPAEKPVQQAPATVQLGKRIDKTEMVSVWKVQNVEQMIAWLEDKMGVKMADWDDDMTADVRAFLESQKAKKEREAKKMQEALKNTDGELPFEV